MNISHPVTNLLGVLVNVCVVKNAEVAVRYFISRVSCQKGPTRHAFTHGR